MGEPFGNDARISRKEHEPALRMLGALMSGMKMDIKLIIVDVQQRIVSSWIQAHYDFKAAGGQPEDKDYMIEYVWITHHNEAGDKIVWMEEFLDVARVCLSWDTKRDIANRIQRFLGKLHDRKISSVCPGECGIEHNVRDVGLRCRRWASIQAVPLDFTCDQGDGPFVRTANVGEVVF